MRSFFYWTLLVMLLVWTASVGWVTFGPDRTTGPVGSLVSFTIAWALAGIPLSLLALVLKPR
jgi:hypothetical protein